MDNYFKEEWREQNPQIAALHDMICPQGYDPPTWRTLYVKNRHRKVGEIWYCLSRGVIVRDNAFVLSWGSSKKECLKIYEHSRWLVEDNLSTLINTVLTECNFDILGIPLNAWETDPA